MKTSFQGQNSPSDMPKARETTVAEFVGRLSALNADLNDRATRLHIVADRLLGGHVEKDGQSSPQPVPNGDLARLHSEMEVYERLTAALTGALARLEEV